MNFSPESIGAITALATIVTTMAGVVYRELKAQIADRDRRIAKLEEGAVELVRAKDAELAEWRRAAQSKAGQ